MANTGFQQVKINDTTQGAYNPTTGQAQLFSTPQTFTDFFGPGVGIDPNAPMATFDTSPLLGKPNQLITVNQITPQSPIPLPAIPSSDNGGSLVTGAKQTSNNIQDYITAATPPVSENQAKQTAIIDRINELLPQTQGQAKSLAEEETKAGVDVYKQQLSDLNNQIRNQTAAYDKTIQDLEVGAGRAGITAGMLSGQQGAVLKQKASEIGMLQAKALGLQGNLVLAQDTARKAVDLKFSPILEELTIKQQQLQAIAPLLDREEKIQATALARQYKDQQEAIEEQKAQTKANLDIVLQSGATSRFINSNGTMIRTSDGKGYGTPEEFFKDAGIASFEEAYRKGIVTDVTQDMIAERDLVNQLANKYWDAGIKFSDSLATARIKLNNSSVYQGEGSGGPGNPTISVTNNDRQIAFGAKMADDAAIIAFVETPKEFRDLWKSQVRPLGNETFTAEQVLENYDSWYKMKQREAEEPDEGIPNFFSPKASGAASPQKTGFSFNFLKPKVAQAAGTSGYVVPGGNSQGFIDSRGTVNKVGAFNSGDIGDTYKKLESFKRSIIQQESKGDYKAVGMMTPYGNALGKYQIIPKFWFSKVGLNPNSQTDKTKFLSTPSLQDRLFKTIIDDLLRKYGNNFSKVAAAYYGGDAAAKIVGTKAADRPQAGGAPSINRYVNEVLSRV